MKRKADYGQSLKCRRRCETVQKHLLKEMLLHANWGLLTYPPPKLGPLEKHLGGEICLRLWGLGYLTHPAEVRWISPGFTEKGNALTTQHNNFTLCDLLRFKIRPLNFCSSQILSLFFFLPLILLSTFTVIFGFTLFSTGNIHYWESIVF